MSFSIQGTKGEHTQYHGMCAVVLLPSGLSLGPPGTALQQGTLHSWFYGRDQQWTPDQKERKEKAQVLGTGVGRSQSDAKLGQIDITGEHSLHTIGSTRRDKGQLVSGGYT